MIRISPSAEPQIVRAVRFGSILENVVVDPWTRAIDYDDDTITENTRATYPVAHIRGHVPAGMGGHPRNVVFLTCDAYGVLPPIAKLTPEMASYHFLSGFTARLAGAEAGVDEPEPTFSACFGAPFMPRPPGRLRRHAGRATAAPRHDLLARQHGLERRTLRRRPAHEDLPHATAGEGRALGRARRRRVSPRPGVQGARAGPRVPGCPPRSCRPRTTWTDAAAYDAQAQALARRFEENFKKYEAGVPSAVATAGPQTR